MFENFVEEFHYDPNRNVTYSRKLMSRHVRWLLEWLFLSI